MADKFRMIRLGMPPELAQEVAGQIDGSGGGDGQALTVAVRAEGKADTALVEVGEAQATADDALVSATPVSGYAAALEQADIPFLQRISATIGGRLVEWVRQTGGTALGGGWAPAGEVTAGHFNGDIAAAAAYAVANPRYELYQQFFRTDVIGSSSTPWLNVSPGGITQPKNHVFIRQDTAVRNDPITMQIQRVVNTDDGLANPKALRVITTVNAETAQTEWAVSGELTSFINAGSTGNTATSGVANKRGLASVFGGHFQANDFNKFSSPTAVTSIVGTEINEQVVGLDHPTAGQGIGLRIVADIIARTNYSVADWNDGTGNFGEGEVGCGIRIRADSSFSNGYFRHGLAILDGPGNPNPITKGALINTAGIYGMQLSGANTASHIFSNGSPATGAIFSGTYSTGNAIRLNLGTAIAMEGTGGIKMLYGSTANVWGFNSGAVERVGFDMSATPRVRIAGVPVLGSRKTGWTADTGTASRAAHATYSATAGAEYTQAEVQTLMDTVRDLTQTVKALKDDLIAHGLIGA